jgi:hypothetical protein
MLSITDWAFSWPISVKKGVSEVFGGGGLRGDEGDE